MFKIYSLKDFIGTAQLKENYQQESFAQEGILQHIRHPLYLATLLLIVGFFLFSPSIANSIVMLVTIAYIFVGILLEEKKLTKLFGKSYEQYKEEVPMIFPKSFRIFH